MAMIDWKSYTDNPNDKEVRMKVRDWLVSVRKLHCDVDVMGYMLPLMTGRRVLDVGVVQHTADYTNQPNWRHGHIAKAASYCLGIDILGEVLEEIARRGFNVKCADATSNLDLIERFDVVFIGDVIEHVDSPVALLKFARRHLDVGGRIFVSTPNPFSRKFLKLFRKDGGAFIPNLDHVSWITPTNAMEIARRSKLELVAYHLVKKFTPKTRFLKSLLWKIEPPEFSFPDYIYEFGVANQCN